jgi:surface polysaccharide O-acyltransferase-like enzyme
MSLLYPRSAATTATAATQVLRPIPSSSRSCAQSTLARETTTRRTVRSGGSNKNYFFVNTIRFWSMVAIVGLHSTAPGDFASPHSRWLLPLFQCVIKFGTIGFFLISGFLLGTRFDECRPMDYLGRRVRKVLLPWLAWTTALAAHGVWHFWRRGEAGTPLLGHLLFETILHSAYWFVPNLMVGLCILLVLRRFIYDIRLGITLLLVNLVYVVNLYGHWFTSEHTTALFGFVIYLWLGAFAAHHYTALESWLAAKSLWLFSTLVLVTFCLTLLEVSIRHRLHDSTAVNTLGIGIQTYSVAVALLLMKLQKRTWPSWIDVRRQTFGIYLIHPLLLIVVRRPIADWLSSRLHGVHTIGDGAWLSLWFTQFVLIYLLSAFTARLISNTPVLGWLISAMPQKRPAMASAAPGAALRQHLGHSRSRAAAAARQGHPSLN